MALNWMYPSNIQSPAIVEIGSSKSTVAEKKGLRQVLELLFLFLLLSFFQTLANLCIKTSFLVSLEYFQLLIYRGRHHDSPSLCTSYFPYMVSSTRDWVIFIMFVG